MTKEIDPQLDLKHNELYIGLAKNGQPNNFATLRPKKTAFNLVVKLERSEEMQQKLDEAGLDLMDYHDKYKQHQKAMLLFWGEDCK